jgi:cytochrome c553
MSDVSNEPRHDHAATQDDFGTRARATMRLHEGDLRHIDELLREGRLGEANTHAFWLTRPHKRKIVATWPAETARLCESAQAMIAADTLEQAARASADIAAACGGCHAVAGASTMFERDVRPPRDDGTSASRLHRHRWAADRIWDGIVGASDRQWRAGLEVYANDLAGYRVQQIAIRGLAGNGDREHVHAELRAACLTCHPSITERRRRSLAIVEAERLEPAP